LGARHAQFSSVDVARYPDERLDASRIVESLQALGKQTLYLPTPAEIVDTIAPKLEKGT
jgi:hypothetical protein